MRYYHGFSPSRIDRKHQFPRKAPVAGAHRGLFRLSTSSQANHFEVYIKAQRVARDGGSVARNVNNGGLIMLIAALSGYLSSI